MLWGARSRRKSRQSRTSRPWAPGMVERKELTSGCQGDQSWEAREGSWAWARQEELGTTGTWDLALTCTSSSQYRHPVPPGWSQAPSSPPTELLPLLLGSCSWCPGVPREGHQPEPGCSSLPGVGLIFRILPLCPRQWPDSAALHPFLSSSPLPSFSLLSRKQARPSQHLGVLTSKSHEQGRQAYVTASKYTGWISHGA